MVFLKVTQEGHPRLLNLDNVQEFAPAVKGDQAAPSQAIFSSGERATYDDSFESIEARLVIVEPSHSAANGEDRLLKELRDAYEADQGTADAERLQKAVRAAFRANARPTGQGTTEEQDTGSDNLNAALDRLKKWVSKPSDTLASEVIVDVLMAAGRLPEGGGATIGKPGTSPPSWAGTGARRTKKATTRGQAPAEPGRSTT